MTGVEGIAWAPWNPDAAATPWTVGVEEEVMLVSPETWLPVSRCEDVLAALPDDLASCARAETHGSALELATTPHETVGAATAQLTDLRVGLAETLDELGLRAAVGGNASDGTLGGHRGLAGRALPVRARVDARAGAPGADVRAARPRRRAGRPRRRCGR